MRSGQDMGGIWAGRPGNARPGPYLPTSREWVPARRHVARKCYIIHLENTRVAHSSALSMTTTTLRIDDELKLRIASAAERVGKTAHAFMLDAVTQTVEQAEHDGEFHRVADARWAKVLATGKTVPWADAQAYLEARARGERPHKPTARKLGR